MRVLVLGGSVFIGRALVARLIAAGHRVEVLNRGSRTTPGARQRSADRDDEAALSTALHDCEVDWVVDVSCYSGEQASKADEMPVMALGMP